MNFREPTCPICGAANAEPSILCVVCGAEISMGRHATESPVGTPQALLGASALKEGSPESKGEILPLVQSVRLCPECGHSNEDWAMLCSGCARELPPIAVEGDAGTGVSGSRLVLVVNGKEFPCVPGDVLGREGSVARRELLNFGTVHRRHAQISFSGGTWGITALASTRNLTEVDGVRLERGRPQSLSGRHVLRLSSRAVLELRVEGSVESSAIEMNSIECG